MVPRIHKALPVHSNALGLGHHEITQRVLDIEALPLEEGPLVQLLASVEAHQDEPLGRGTRPGATTLAVRMDQSVATKLWGELHAVFRTMDWPQPE